MTGTTTEARVLAEAVADAAARLSVDVEQDIVRVREYLDGPGVVAVAGLPNEDRDDLTADLRKRLDDMPESTVVTEYDVDSDVATSLWDVLVLVTPADRALSHAEETLVRTAVEQGRSAIVVVGRMQVLGPEPSAAVAELERFRLGPALGVLNVPWHFDDRTAAARAAVIDDAAGRLRAAGRHESAARLALHATTDRVIARFAELLTARDRDYGLLADVRSTLPSARTFVDDQIRLTGLAVLDRLRTAEDHLYTAADDAVAAADQWIATDGIGDWADVERPLTRAWAHLVQQAGTTLPQQAAALRSTLRRAMDGVLDPLGRLEVTVPPAATPDQAWESTAARDALALLDAVDITPVLARLRERAESVLPSPEDDPGPSTQKDADGPHRGAAAQVVRRTADLGKRIGRRVAGAESTDLRAPLHAELRALVQTRVAEAMEALGTAALEAARADTELVAKSMEDAVTRASDALGERYAWVGPYDELVTLRLKS